MTAGRLVPDQAKFHKSKSERDEGKSRPFPTQVSLVKGKEMNYMELLFGAILGWLITRLASYFSKPKLTFKIDNGQLFQNGVGQYRFLSIRIINKPNNLFFKLISFLFGKTNLNNAKAQINFSLPENSKFTIKTINNGRWATTKEPVDYSTGKVDYSQILMPSRDSIFVEEEGMVNIAIKKEDDKSFYAFNNESYDSRWWPLKPEFEINEKYLVVTLKLLADGDSYDFQCALVNSNKKLNNFYLKLL